MPKKVAGGGGEGDIRNEPSVCACHEGNIAGVARADKGVAVERAFKKGNLLIGERFCTDQMQRCGTCAPAVLFVAILERCADGGFGQVGDVLDGFGLGAGFVPVIICGDGCRARRAEWVVIPLADDAVGPVGMDTRIPRWVIFCPNADIVGFGIVSDNDSVGTEVVCQRMADFRDEQKEQHQDYV